MWNPENGHGPSITSFLLVREVWWETTAVESLMRQASIKSCAQC
jgi:hypothetical protein